MYKVESLHAGLELAEPQSRGLPASAVAATSSWTKCVSQTVSWPVSEEKWEQRKVGGSGSGRGVGACACAKLKLEILMEEKIFRTLSWGGMGHSLSA